jgi:hypothetical protein
MALIMRLAKITSLMIRSSSNLPTSRRPLGSTDDKIVYHQSMAMRMIVAPYGASLFGQELNLEQYLQRLKSAPGVTVADKMEFLTWYRCDAEQPGRA